MGQSATRKTSVKRISAYQPCRSTKALPLDEHWVRSGYDPTQPNGAMRIGYVSYRYGSYMDYETMQNDDLADR